MAQKATKVKPAPQRRSEPEEEREAVSGGRITKEDIDAMLDEIDDVLETNAEEFVRAYIQKGGQ